MMNVTLWIWYGLTFMGALFTYYLSHVLYLTLFIPRHITIFEDYMILPKTLARTASTIVYYNTITKATLQSASGSLAIILKCPAGTVTVSDYVLSREDYLHFIELLENKVGELEIKAY